MKKKILVTAILATQLFAVDYSTFTNDELFSSKGTIAEENRDAFRSEMQSRMQTLNPEEKSSYRGSGQGQGSMTQTRTQQKLQDGSGGGNMYKGSRGMGGGGRR